MGNIKFGEIVTQCQSSRQELANQPLGVKREKEPIQLPQTEQQVSFAELPFIDRNHQLLDLDKYLKEAASGEGRIVFLMGEPGVGKTRIATEISRHAERTGFRCLEAKCVSDITSPLLPWVQYLSQFCKSATADVFFKVCRDSLDQIVRLVPDLRETVHLQRSFNAVGNISDSGSPRRNPEEIQREEMQFILALTQVFSRLSEISPLLLILDDMQWCDPSSMKAIDLMISKGLKSRILLLCLVRDVDLKERTNPAVTGFIETVRPKAFTRFISLSRFTEENIRELTEEFFSGPHDLSMNELRAMLYSRTRGNPLFVSEILKSLLELRIISNNNLGRWTCSLNASDFRIPETIKKVIEQRLELLDNPALDMLRQASVIGEQFSIETLDQVMAQQESRVQLSQSLETALKSGLIVGRESTTAALSFIFSDESVREVLYDQLDHNQKKNLHLVVGRALEPLLEGGSSVGKPRFSELANHFLKGGDLIKASYYYVQAGKRASGLYAHVDSFTFYQKALEILEEDRSTNRREQNPQLSLEKADLLARMGDEAQFLPQIQKTYGSWKTAAELYEKCGEKLKAADLLVKIGVFYQLIMYDLDASEAALQRAVKLAGESATTSSSELARITAWALVADIWRGDRKKLIGQSSVAMKLAEESGAHDVIAMLSSYGIAANLVGEINESLESCNKGLGIALEHDLVLEASYNYFHKAVTWNYTCGPSKKTLELFLEGLNFTASRGNFMVNLFHKVELSYGVYLPLGEWEKAREMAEEAFNSVQGFPPNSLFRLISESAMGQLLLHFGDLEKARGYFEHVRSVTKGFGILQLDVPLYISLARLNIGTKNFEEARKSLEIGYRISKQRGLTVINAVPHLQLLDLMIEFSMMNESEKSADKESALEDTFEDLIKSSKEINQPWTDAYLKRSEAWIALQRKDVEAAADLFKESIDVFEKLGWPYEGARTQVHLGIVNLRRGRIGSALELFNSASGTFSRLGARADLERIAQMKGDIEGQGLTILDEPPKFEGPDATLVFGHLVTGFLEDSLIKKLSSDNCGWRTLNQLSNLSNLPRSSFYTSASRGGEVFKELVKSGLVETRVYPGERGRGGNVLKMRVAINKNRGVRDYIGLTSEDSKR